LRSAHQTIITEGRAAIAQTRANSAAGSNDGLMDDVLRTHEQQVWFLAEHLVETPLVPA
jgi:starvation-inducible DNA-binding protein